MPQVSVIMPVYNTEQYLGESIESILQQTFSDFEFLIIDDGSNDKSWEIIQSYEKKDERIKAFQNKTNKGISYTRNKLVNIATTNFIAPQDSDDISIINRIELEYNFLKNNPNCAVVSGNNIIINEEGNTIGFRKYKNDIKNIILKKSPISQGSSIFKKDIFYEVGGYDTQLNYGEDYDLWLKIFSKGYKIQNLSENLYKVRIRVGQTKTEKLKDTIKNTIYIQKRAIKEYGICSSFSDRVYHMLEKVLLFCPSSFVLYLFKKIEYTNAK